MRRKDRADSLSPFWERAGVRGPFSAVPQGPRSPAPLAIHGAGGRQAPLTPAIPKGKREQSHQGTVHNRFAAAAGLG